MMFQIKKKQKKFSKCKAHARIMCLYCDVEIPTDGDHECIDKGCVPKILNFIIELMLRQCSFVDSSDAK